MAACGPCKLAVRVRSSVLALCGCLLDGEEAAFQADIGGFDSRHPLFAPWVGWRDARLTCGKYRDRYPEGASTPDKPTGKAPVSHTGRGGFDSHVGYSSRCQMQSGPSNRAFNPILAGSSPAGSTPSPGCGSHQGSHTPFASAPIWNGTTASTRGLAGSNPAGGIHPCFRGPSGRAAAS